MSVVEDVSVVADVFVRVRVEGKQLWMFCVFVSDE